MYDTHGEPEAMDQDTKDAFVSLIQDVEQWGGHPSSDFIAQHGQGVKKFTDVQIYLQKTMWKIYEPAHLVTMMPDDPSGSWSQHSWPLAADKESWPLAADKEREEKFVRSMARGAWFMRHSPKRSVSTMPSLP